MLFSFTCNLLVAQDTLNLKNQSQDLNVKHPQDPVKPDFLIQSRNNDFRLGIGGFVKLNGLYDFVALENTNSFITEQIPVGKDNIRDNHLNMDVNQTRLYTEVIGNTPFGEMKVRFEGEFSKPNGGINIKQAYGFFKGFLVGKTTSTLVDLEAIPYTIDAEGPNSIVFSRNVMIRYSFNAGKYITFSMAAEAGLPKVTHSDYTSELYQYLPDVVFRIRMKNEKGHLSVGCLYRYFTYEDTLTFKERGHTGWGLTLGGDYRLLPKVRLIFQGSYGTGIASYFHDFINTTRDFVPSPAIPGTLEPVPVMGGCGALEMKWTRKTKSSFIYSYLMSSDIGNKPGSSYRNGNYISGNFAWSVLPNLQLAVELINGNRVNKDWQRGSATRIYFMAKFEF